MVLLAMSVLPTQTVNAKPPDRPNPPTAQTGITEKAPRSVVRRQPTGRDDRSVGDQAAVALAPCRPRTRLAVRIRPRPDRSRGLRRSNLRHRLPGTAATVTRRRRRATRCSPAQEGRGSRRPETGASSSSCSIHSSTTETSCWSTIAAPGPRARSTVPNSRTASSTTTRSWLPWGLRHALGADADRYGTGDVALDIEAVRQALGYPQLSYFGPSYGSVAVQAYAVRFPQRLRVIVIDAGLPVSDHAHSKTWGLDVPQGVRAEHDACLPARSRLRCDPARRSRRARRPRSGGTQDTSRRLSLRLERDLATGPHR